MNQLTSVWAGEATPGLACLVGFHSIESENIWRSNCSEAHQHRLDVSKELRKDLKWPKEKRFIQYEYKFSGCYVCQLTDNPPSFSLDQNYLL